MLNGAGLLIASALTGWLYFFSLLGEIDLWPIINHVPINIGGEQRAWNMAHLEGITNGLMLIGFAAAAPFIKLGPRQQSWFFHASLIFAWLFTLPAIANAMLGTRGLAFDGGPFASGLANQIIYLTGWPPILAVHIALPLALWGAVQHYRSLEKPE